MYMYMYMYVHIHVHNIVHHVTISIALTIKFCHATVAHLQYQQLMALEQQINSRISSADSGTDVGYWESLLQQLKAHMARVGEKPCNTLIVYRLYMYNVCVVVHVHVYMYMYGVQVFVTVNRLKSGDECTCIHVHCTYIYVHVYI